jgi:integrase
VLPRVPPRRVVPLTVEQVDLLIAGTPEQYRALTILGVGTGLRAGELFGLQVPPHQLPAPHTERRAAGPVRQTGVRHRR